MPLSGNNTEIIRFVIDPIINKYFGKLIPRSLENLIGVQFRNNATIGGAIFARLGFSEINTALLVLDCKLELVYYGKWIQRLQHF